MKRFCMYLLVCILVAALIAGCAANDVPSDDTSDNASQTEKTDETEPQKSLKFGISLDSVDSGFWIATMNEFEKLAAENNVELVLVIAEGDANKQNQQVENLIAQDCDVIIIGANDGNAIATAVKKCKEENVPVIMYSRACESDEVEPDLQILAENVKTTEALVDWVADRARAENRVYNVGLVIGSMSEQNSVERRQGHLLGIENNSDVLNLVQEIPTDWNAELALTNIQNAYEANPDIDCLLIPCDAYIIQARSVLESLNKWHKVGEEGHVVITGFDGDTVMAQGMEDQYVDASISSDVPYMTKLSFEWAFKLLDGEKPDSVTVFDPGLMVTSDNWDEKKEGVWGYLALSN